MVMMRNQWQVYEVELIVTVLFLTIFSGYNGRNIASSQPANHSRSSAFEGEYDSVQETSTGVEFVGATENTIYSNPHGLKRRNAQSAQNIKLGDEEKVGGSRFSIALFKESTTFLPSTISSFTEPTTSSHHSISALNSLTLDKAEPTQIPGESENNDNISKGVLDIAEDASEIPVISPTTYRPVRPSNTQNISAQERERKLMNVLAARRNALHRGSFRTRPVTTWRTASVASLGTTSKTPTDPRSACLRNCTKNFTRRTTASCMRQCSNFSRTSWPVANSTAASSMVIVRPSSQTGIGTQSSDRDNNEILFTDESSHGLFVVAKEQNDTSNHIPDVAKSTKFRTRNKLLVPVTAAPSSVEDDDIKPYLYFGQKLPPIKPATLTITSVSEDHPKLLEVSAAHLASTTQASVGSTSTLSAVERSRSRYKYRDRGYVNARRPSIRASALGSTNPSEARSTPLLNIKVNDSATEKETSTIKTLESNNSNVGRKASYKLPPPVQSTTTSDPFSPLIIRVFGEEDETSQAERPMNESVLQKNSTSEFITPQEKSIAVDTQTINIGNLTLSSSPLPNILEQAVTDVVPVKILSLGPYPSTSRASSTTPTPSITKTSISKGLYSETVPTTIPTIRSTTVSSLSNTARPKIDIKEDIEKLRSLGPSLTQVIENDENFVIFLNHSTAQTVLNTSDTQLSILHTTVLTSVRSTVNPRTETSAMEVENTSTQMNLVNRSSFVGIIETTSLEKSTRNEHSSDAGADIKSTYVPEESEVSLEMRRVNIATMVLAGIGIIPLCALILYFVHTYLLRRGIKNEEDFDVCITDQQPISPVKKLDSKYRIKNEEEDYDADRHNIQTSHHQSIHHKTISHGKITSRDVNQNNRYDEQSSVTSDQEFERNNIRLKSLLGEGNFGQVWKAEADDLSGHFGATRIVAVKTIRKCSAQTSLKEEADIMRKLGSHLNVVTLLGACIENEPHMLIMEYAMRGRLLSLLRAARSASNILPASVPGGRSLTPLSPRTLAGFALDIACGMEYIAEKRIVHRDLAARNVLLDHNGVCKICDFGMSIDLDSEHKKKEAEKCHANEIVHSNAKKIKFDFRSRFTVNQWSNNNSNCSDGSPTLKKDLKEKKYNSHGLGQGHDTISRRPALPIRWMAPEALQYHVFTRETDMWAFGIVLWEIATLGSTPYANHSGREVMRRVPSGLRPELPKEGCNEFYNLMVRCWHKDPHLRPSFSYARQEISRSLHKWVDDDATGSDYMDVSGFSEDLEHGMVYFNHRISEFECEI
ncbi:PREDICTED: uncharacterized protein LOC108369832 [Rhagoletis zephyria]|uniref:uncharacterized protein LOC108369832 n=1 Tax=Rhagoletis zephyria TaxID=28612 RepID=UPI0008115CAF|nr:PREDICTED: uncharacterized protein LOC108369832 [Rhagoletis zephyria]